MGIKDVVKSDYIDSIITYKKPYLSCCGQDLSLKYKYETEYSKVKVYKLSKEELEQYLKKYEQYR